MTSTVTALRAAETETRVSHVPPLPTIMIEPLVRAALLEDLGRAGDLTTDAIVPAEARAETALVARKPGVVAGLDFAIARLPPDRSRDHGQGRARRRHQGRAKATSSPRSPARRAAC